MQGPPDMKMEDYVRVSLASFMRWLALHIYSRYAKFYLAMEKAAVAFQDKETSLPVIFQEVKLKDKLKVKLKDKLKEMPKKYRQPNSPNGMQIIEWQCRS